MSNNRWNRSYVCEGMKGLLGSHSQPLSRNMLFCKGVDRWKGKCIQAGTTVPWPNPEFLLSCFPKTHGWNKTVFFPNKESKSSFSAIRLEFPLISPNVGDIFLRSLSVRKLRMLCLATWNFAPFWRQSCRGLRWWTFAKSSATQFPGLSGKGRGV